MFDLPIFTSVSTSSGNAGIQITVGGEAKVVSPEEVGAGILSYLKKVSPPLLSNGATSEAL